MTWRAMAYDEDTSAQNAFAELPDYGALCRWIRNEAHNEKSTIHVIAPHDATSDQLSELRRAGVRVSFAT